ncbi:hypothetical protein AMELA_G00029240 [Ameiurus melas]|uniref:Uncharacterized protein n=1 Tax=Ameiurus melas TaxID=219545 RepID=A0A7J6BDE2_AMEME|nr:hypothetical protein AMELA_G00029240 [Ameiurus melas]
MSTASPATYVNGSTVNASLALYVGIGAIAGLLLIVVPIIICIVKAQKRRKYRMYMKNEMQHIGDTDASPQAEDEDDEPDYENIDADLQEAHDSDESENDYLNVEACGQSSAAVDNDYEGEGVYANCSE